MFAARGFGLRHFLNLRLWSFINSLAFAVAQFDVGVWQFGVGYSWGIVLSCDWPTAAEEAAQTLNVLCFVYASTSVLWFSYVGMGGISVAALVAA